MRDYQRLKTYRILYPSYGGAATGAIDVIAQNKNEAVTNAYQYLIQNWPQSGIRKRDLTVELFPRKINKFGIYQHIPSLWR